MSYKELSPGQKIVYETLFKGFAKTEFENRDRGLPNEVHIARLDYEISSSEDHPSIVREPNGEYMMKTSGDESNGAWMVLSLVSAQVKKPNSTF